MKYNLEYIKNQFEKENYTLLSNTYKNTKSKLKYKSPSGIIGYIAFDKWLRGQRHPKENDRYYNLDKISKILFDSGFTLLDTEYQGSKSKIFYKCNLCDTYNSVVWSQWFFKKNKCSGCTKNKKKYFFIDNIEKDGYCYVSGDYITNRSNLVLICSNNHEYITNRFNFVTNGSRCPICNCLGESKPEKEIMDLLHEHDIKFIHRDRSIIYPYELDIVIPDKKIAVEYCGLYWHSETMGKDINYHLNKLNLCKNKGYNLITIFEDEWVNKKDIVISRMESLLRLCEKRIYARNCIVKEISTFDATQFCEINHLQGYTGSSIKLGLYNQDELVSVMTFSKPSISKGQRNIKKDIWELSRFCSKLKFNIIGGASKLLSYFKKNYTWKEIYSYADRRWSQGYLYEKIGFYLVGITKPNYWYTNDTNLKYKRVHRFSLRKNINDIKDISEYQNRLLEGYRRIWDCGNLKYSIKSEII